MTERRPIPIQLVETNTAATTERSAADRPPLRDNPMVWDGEEPATGVFIGHENPLEALDLLGVPSFALSEAPQLPEDFVPSQGLRAWLDGLLQTLRSRPEVTHILPFEGLSALDRQAIDEILGEGEVTGNLSFDGEEYTIRESTLAGVWSVCIDSGRRWVEVGAVPEVVVRAATNLEAAPFDVPAGGEGLMNAPAVLAEISERAAICAAASDASAPSSCREPNHVLNFTLLPLSEADEGLLTGVLGRASLELRSGGFGECQVFATRYRHVWAVQYINAMGHVILDTVEVGDVPTAVTAASEDLEDSALRLGQILEAYL